MTLDGAIPADNPSIAGVRSHVYTYGHRNIQGLVFGPDGTLYASEHGPSTDDEVNRLVAGRNYGWPHVAGFNDDRSYVYANWSKSAPDPCASLKFSSLDVPSSVPATKESAWSHPDFTRRWSRSSARRPATTSAHSVGRRSRRAGSTSTRRPRSRAGAGRCS
jgi:hypothetical protein